MPCRITRGLDRGCPAGGAWCTTGGNLGSATGLAQTDTRVKLFDVDLSGPTNGRLDAALSGEIDLSTVAELEQRLEDPLHGGPTLLVLDLRQVTFLDSSGLRLLLRLDERQRGLGGRMVLVQGGRRVARVLELTGAGERLEMVTDPSEID